MNAFHVIHGAELGDRVMTGTITLVYDHTVGQVQAKLAPHQAP